MESSLRGNPTVVATPPTSSTRQITSPKNYEGVSPEYQVTLQLLETRLTTITTGIESFLAELTAKSTDSSSNGEPAPISKLSQGDIAALLKRYKSLKDERNSIQKKTNGALLSRKWLVARNPVVAAANIASAGYINKKIGTQWNGKSPYERELTRISEACLALKKKLEASEVKTNLARLKRFGQLHTYSEQLAAIESRIGGDQTKGSILSSLTKATKLLNTDAKAARSAFTVIKTDLAALKTQLGVISNKGFASPEARLIPNFKARIDTAVQRIAELHIKVRDGLQSAETRREQEKEITKAKRVINRVAKDIDEFETAVLAGGVHTTLGVRRQYSREQALAEKASLLEDVEKSGSGASITSNKWSEEVRLALEGEIALLRTRLTGTRENLKKADAELSKRMKEAVERGGKLNKAIDGLPSDKSYSFDRIHQNDQDDLEKAEATIRKKMVECNTRLEALITTIAGGDKSSTKALFGKSEADQAVQDVKALERLVNDWKKDVERAGPQHDNTIAKAVYKKLTEVVIPKEIAPSMAAIKQRVADLTAAKNGTYQIPPEGAANIRFNALPIVGNPESALAIRTSPDASPEQENTPTSGGASGEAPELQQAAKKKQKLSPLEALNRRYQEFANRLREGRKQLENLPAPLTDDAQVTLNKYTSEKLQKSYDALLRDTNAAQEKAQDSERNDFKKLVTKIKNLKTGLLPQLIALYEKISTSLTRKSDGSASNSTTPAIKAPDSSDASGRDSAAPEERTEKKPPVPKQNREENPGISKIKNQVRAYTKQLKAIKQQLEKAIADTQSNSSSGLVQKTSTQLENLVAQAKDLTQKIASQQDNDTSQQAFARAISTEAPTSDTPSRIELWKKDYTNAQKAAKELNSTIVTAEKRIQEMLQTEATPPPPLRTSNEAPRGGSDAPQGTASMPISPALQTPRPSTQQPEVTEVAPELPAAPKATTPAKSGEGAGAPSQGGRSSQAAPLTWAQPAKDPADTATFRRLGPGETYIGTDRIQYQIQSRLDELVKQYENLEREVDIADNNIESLTRLKSEAQALHTSLNTALEDIEKNVRILTKEEHIKISGRLTQLIDKLSLLKKRFLFAEADAAPRSSRGTANRVQIDPAVTQHNTSTHAPTPLSSVETGALSSTITIPRRENANRMPLMIEDAPSQPSLQDIQAARSLVLAPKLRPLTVDAIQAHNTSTTLPTPQAPTPQLAATPDTSADAPSSQ